MEGYPINHKWANYYRALEVIRRSGEVNMWGAAPVLASKEGLTQILARQVLMSWIANYTELKKIYNW